MLRRAQEGGSVPRLDVSDPFLLAFLRGGKAEMLRVGLFSLVDRGLFMLVGGGAQLVIAEPMAAEKVRRPLEKELLRKFNEAHAPQSVLTVSSPILDGDEYQQTLESLQLLPDESQKARRVWLFIIGALGLGGLAAVKVFVALSRGRSNVGFLIILGALSLVLVGAVLFPRRTSLGSRALEDLQRLTQPMKGRAASLQPGGGTAEAVLLAAIFGFYTLPSAFSYLTLLFPPRRSSSFGSNSGTSCGSASGTSCGSAGGSSCGGGGCGGGCGGCGS